MPAKRRQNQPQPTAHSDYDTESAAVPLHTTAPKRSIQELNYTVLSRYVPGLQRIVSIASFTVVYVFSPESQQWEKSGVEGTLFLCQTSDGASVGYAVVILNRKSLDNFITHLTSADDVELTDEYVILQGLSADGAPRIYGLWIFSEAETVPSTKELVGLAIQECAMRLDQVEELREAEEETYEEPYEEEAVQQDVQQGQSIDLATLFAKPQIQPETHIRPPAQVNEVAGQRMDLLKLFGQPQIQAEDHIHQQQQARQYVQSQYQSQNQPQFQNQSQPQFQPHPQIHPQMQNSPYQQQSQPTQQQNALLNLFKTGNG